MEKKKSQKVIEEAKRMENDEVYNLFLDNINKEIDRTIEELMEKKHLTANRVLEDYSLQIKKALFISRSQI